MNYKKLADINEGLVFGSEEAPESKVDDWKPKAMDLCRELLRVIPDSVVDKDLDMGIVQIMRKIQIL